MSARSYSVHMLLVLLQAVVGLVCGQRIGHLEDREHHVLRLGDFEHQLARQIAIRLEDNLAIEAA